MKKLRIASSIIIQQARIRSRGSSLTFSSRDVWNLNHTNN